MWQAVEKSERTHTTASALIQFRGTDQREKPVPMIARDRAQREGKHWIWTSGTEPTTEQDGTKRVQLNVTSVTKETDTRQASYLPSMDDDRS